MKKTFKIIALIAFQMCLTINAMAAVNANCAAKIPKLNGKAKETETIRPKIYTGMNGGMVLSIGGLSTEMSFDELNQTYSARIGAYQVLIGKNVAKGGYLFAPVAVDENGTAHSVPASRYQMKCEARQVFNMM